jgi:hypothetical protein
LPSLEHRQDVQVPEGLVDDIRVEEYTAIDSCYH